MTFSIPAIPTPITWYGETADQPKEWRAEADSAIEIVAGPKTDWFIDPETGAKTHNAPAAVFSPPDDAFTLSARVQVDFKATFDAAVLVVHESDDVWAKLCFERSPDGTPMIVSVVTRDRSDDCNSVPITSNEAVLRIAVRGAVLAFYYGSDRRKWNLVRYCSLGEVSNLKVGFLTQSPTGSGCRAGFLDIRYAPRFPADLRSGT